MRDLDVLSLNEALQDCGDLQQGDIGCRSPFPFLSEDTGERHARLAELIADKVIPRLLTLHNGFAADSGQIAHAGEAEIAELTRLVLGPDNSDATDYILGLKNRGLSLDLLHTELLEPTARHLGELWNQDEVDFLDVTIGVSRLQRLVHVFEDLDEIPSFGDMRRVLIMATPGEQHSFGTVVVQNCLRAGGWHVCSCDSSQIGDIAAIVAREWFGVVGFSLAAECNMGTLAEVIRRVRDCSLNKSVGVMVGGPAFFNHPERVVEVGADATAVNGAAAVVVAKKLLVAGLAGLKASQPTSQI
jgi:MerR family transcriptional regulator, light-induced transcriptional regulator